MCEMMTAVSIRPAQMDDTSSIWRIIGPTIRAGETYALDREITELVGVRAAARVQFNFVVSTNTRTVALRPSLGFEIVGRPPQAF